MEVKRIYEEDLQIARSLINRDEMVTRKFFYQQCYPLFKSIFDNYYTDCNDCKEFIDEIYILVLTPSRSTGHCQLENYRGESSLASWIKVCCLYYCYRKNDLQAKMPKLEPLQMSVVSETDSECDISDGIYGSIEMDFRNLNYQDALIILGQMPNKRYSELIRLRYLEQKSNEETAEALGMTMDNYYNKHKLAKEQYERIFRKEVGHA